MMNRVLLHDSILTGNDKGEEDFYRRLFTEVIPNQLEKPIYLANGDSLDNCRTLYAELKKSGYLVFSYRADVDRFGNEAYDIRDCGILDKLKESSTVLVIYNEYLTDESAMKALADLPNVSFINLPDVYSALNFGVQGCLF